MLDLAYEVKISTRARKIRLSVYRDGRVVVTVPRRFGVRVGEQFFAQHAAWIKRKIERWGERWKDAPILPEGNYQQDKERAREFVCQKIEQFKLFYPFSFGRVSIKNNTSKWGSCSRQKNLNFHYKILYLPECMADYLIVHELCHLKEMNHGPRFWQLVSQQIPEYKVVRRNLRLIGLK